MKSYVRVVSVNILLLFTLLIAPSLILNSYKILRSKISGGSSESIDKRAYYPAYKDKKLAKEFFQETNTLVNDYRSFIGWRSRTVKYKHINKSYN